MRAWQVILTLVLATSPATAQERPAETTKAAGKAPAAEKPVLPKIEFAVKHGLMGSATAAAGVLAVGAVAAAVGLTVPAAVLWLTNLKGSPTLSPAGLQQWTANSAGAVQKSSPAAWSAGVALGVALGVFPGLLLVTAAGVAVTALSAFKEYDVLR